MRAKRSNPESLRGRSLDCFVAALLAMTMEQNKTPERFPAPALCSSADKAYAALKPATAFTSRKSSRPYLPHSRPLPDCL
ncbi:hypothetical protein C7G41_11575 [Bradyrhizobium sp. MOS002]|nr:hypothetical protein C7G41_11575 [Bradyrhizobium sp. MOS002]